MGRLKIKKKWENKLIWRKLRGYIDLVILICCTVVAINIHPTKSTSSNDNYEENSRMLYIFHDFYWNEYILNESVHWSASSWEYLFDDNVPETIKSEENYKPTSVSLWEGKSWDVKDNQVSLNEIFSTLWVNEENHNSWNAWNLSNEEDMLVISLSWLKEWEDKDEYTVTSSWNTMIIERNNETEQSNETWEIYVWKLFNFITDWQILPTLVPRKELTFSSSEFISDAVDSNKQNKAIESINISWNNKIYDEYNEKSWVTIIDNYESCITPRWYEIVHWDSVLAYQQLDNAPNICNIERRFCRKWKLSWTFTQQWCYTNDNYTFAEFGESYIENTGKTKDDSKKYGTTQYDDWTVYVNDSEIGSSYVFDKPNNTSTPEYSYSDNVKQATWIEQTTRPHWDCTAPRWEKVKHGQFIQAFKHANWFSDAPCEAQIRLCSMWDLMWTYIESSCKTRDTSFIDWINWSNTRDTYSKEKIEWVKKQIKYENIYDKDYRRLTNSEALDQILKILEK